MPTSEYKDEVVEEMYDKIEEILEEDGKGETNTIILGDCNCVTGDKSYKIFTGPHGQGRRNHRCQMHIDFHIKKGLAATSTWFKKQKT
jgi:endonuclease/exonuclease/phosphatase family metal-dependent hydrolase